ncbi:MAG: hypothetical protein ACUVQY_07795 [Thermoproteota archaeon]
MRGFFFVGSLGGKDLLVGTLVLPTKIVDKTGFVSADDPSKQIRSPVHRLKMKQNGVKSWPQ